MLKLKLPTPEQLREVYHTEMKEAFPAAELKPLAEGLRESYDWYRSHREGVMTRPYRAYIAEHLK